MTVGEGILWSTFVLVIFFSIVLLTKHKRWKAFLKGFGILVIIGTVIGIATWGYFKYENRPQLMTELNGIRLGMSEIDVTLKKGKPDDITELQSIPDGFRKLLLYKNYSDAYTYVILRGKKDSMVVTNVCDSGGYGRVLGFGEYSSERNILEKLGEPSNISINRKGTEKILSYPQWNAAFTLAKGLVTEVCVTNQPKMSYSVEYGKKI